ncbi:MAG: zinc-ribbon domain-containing protein [Tissierellia bacterium]|nr:zinc-ribbon domain-containing protein [Tissierellia bacterium]
MGIIKAVTGAVGGALADQWLDAFEAYDMGPSTVFTYGAPIRNDKRSSNTKGTSDYITDGSKIHVGPNQFMMLLDGGRVVDYTAEEGYYTVDMKTQPSLFNGDFGDAIKESFERIKFGGGTPTKQQVFYINLQEIKNIKFGTANPLNYFDDFYNAELFLRTFGDYSIRITDPLKFFREVVPRNANKVDIDEIDDQFYSEFMTALQSTMNKMSADGFRISHVSSRGQELSDYMSQALDEKWMDLRGFEIVSVGITSISYDDESKELINMRNKGAMLGDPSVREGYVQGSIARGLEAAGSNEGGATGAFIGMGMGMQNAGSYMAGVSQVNQQQMQAQQQAQQQAQSQQVQGQAGGWKCTECGTSNSGKFCTNCGAKAPEVSASKFCSNCGTKLGEGAKFCTECGTKL